MRWLMPLGFALLLAGCGGGGGSTSSSPSTPPVPPAPRTPPLFAYFGLASRQIEETADHVTAVMTPDWGNWDDPADRERIAHATIDALLAARAHGIERAIVSCGFLCFTAMYRYRGVEDLVAFRQRVEAAGLASMVTALYPIDEPDGHPTSDAVMTQAYSEIRAAWPGPAIAVIYGDMGHFPGLSAVDWAGRDDYGRGNGVLERLPPIRGDQRWIVVPGGCDPWRQDPQAFVEFAQRENVAWFCPFIWLDQWGGTSNAGIRSNGLAESYRAAAATLNRAPAP
jgi:hypothetical protein